MKYWIALTSRSFRRGEKDPLYSIEYLEDLSEYVPTSKENLFGLIKEGKADWKYIDRKIQFYRLRCRFNSARDLSCYLFTADEDIKYEHFTYLANENPKKFIELLEKQGELIGI